MPQSTISNPRPEADRTTGLFLCMAWVIGVVNGHLTWGTGLFAYSTFCLYFIVEEYLTSAIDPGKQGSSIGSTGGRSSCSACSRCRYGQFLSRPPN
jgi:hypothetical protein